MNELASDQVLEMEVIRNLPSRSPIKLAWVCKRDPSHIWTASVASRVLGSGCLVCKGNVVVRGFNDLASQRPELLDFWDYESNEISPDDVTPHSRKLIAWKCNNGHRWRERPAALASGKRCGFCAGHRIDFSNSLRTLAPHLLFEWDQEKNSLSPDEVGPKSGKVAHWICGNGHAYKSRIIGRYVRGDGCPTCAGKVLQAGFNDLASRFPEIASEWSTRNEESPTQVGQGSTSKYWWTCSTCTYEWNAKVVNRTRGSGCPKCSKTGYDPSQKGYLYLLAKEDLGFQQFGITNDPERRLNNHRKAGWLVLDVVGPSDGIWIQQTETLLKRFFRSRGTLLPRTYPDKFVGYTETWTCNDLEYENLAALLLELSKWEVGLGSLSGS